MCSSICACVVEPPGNKGPCRALGVLIRQPQPGRVDHTERKREWRGERERGWTEDEVKSVCKGAKHTLIFLFRLVWRERVRGGGKMLKMITDRICLWLQNNTICQVRRVLGYRCTEEHHRCSCHDELHGRPFFACIAFSLCLEFTWDVSL